MKRFSLFWLLLVVVGAVGCGQAATPETVTVRETVVVEKEVTQVVEKEVTTVVEVEKEVTTVVEVPVAAGESCGHEIVIGINGDGQSANPLYGSDSSTIWRTDQISEPLVFLDWETLQPIPWLAESWEVSDDGTTYTFHLRTGPQWPDGTPLTAEDFEFTVLTILSPDYTGQWQGIYTDIVGAEEVIAGETTELEGFTVIDEKTFEIKLKAPNAGFLPFTARNFKPIPKHLLEGEKLTPDHPFMQNPVGVGPYRLVEHVKGDHLTMEAKDDYWGEPVCAKRITERIIPDMNALAAALEAGDIDQMNPLEPRYVQQFTGNPDIQIHEPPSPYMDAIYFNFNNEVLANPAVRQAIALTLNMEEFSEKVLGGIQAPILGPLMPASWAYDPEIREPGQDLEKAQEVLAATTIPAGTTLKIKTNAGNTTREQMATYAQAQLAKIGITAEVEFQEWSTFFGDVIDGNFDMIVLTSNAGIPDPDTLHTDYHTDGARNYGKYSNPEVDRLLEEARGTMDVDQRKELYKQAQELLVQDLPRIWAYEYLYSIATRSNITNVRPSALGPMWDAKYWHKN